MLRVIPHRSHGVTVEISHYEPSAMTVVGTSWRKLGKVGELVHQAHVVLLLLGEVTVVAVAGKRLRAIVTERIYLIRIEVQQRRRESVNRRRVVSRMELGLAGRIGGVRGSAEIVIKGLVFIENNHQVFDRCGGRKTIRLVGDSSCHCPVRKQS